MIWWVQNKGCLHQVPNIREGRSTFGAVALISGPVWIVHQLLVFRLRLEGPILEQQRCSVGAS